MGCTFPKTCPKKALKMIGPRPANISTVVQRAHMLQRNKGDIVRIVGTYGPVDTPAILARLPAGILGHSGLRLA